MRNETNIYKLFNEIKYTGVFVIKKHNQHTETMQDAGGRVNWGNVEME